MIHGRVIGLQANVGIVFHLGDGRVIEIEFVVDTGFAGALTLPRETIQALNLTFFVETAAKLADDHDIKTDVHTATIEWNGRLLEVAVLAMGRRPLLGTALLEGHHLRADFTENGLVSIDGLA